MGLMLEKQQTHLTKSPAILISGISVDERDKLADAFDVGVTTHFCSSNQVLLSMVGPETQVILIDLTGDDFSDFLSIQDNLRTKWPSIPVLLKAKDLSVNQLSKLINEFDIYTIISDKMQLKKSLQEALVENVKRKSYIENLKLLKVQNQKLESLNQNLEDLVHQRTINEFQANQQAENSLRKIQQILNFIKKISSSNGLEDLLTNLSNEFKRFQSSMPPILIIIKSENDKRIHYFQGRQLVEKTVKLSSHFADVIDNHDSNKLRHDLSNIFGRPFGSVIVEPLVFQSAELESVKALLVFEHSFNESAQKDFKNFSLEHVSIVNMALENILLKESLQAIARQWAKTFNQMEDPILIVNQNYQISLSNADFHKKSKSLCYEVFAKRTKPCNDCPIVNVFNNHEPKTSDISIDGKIFSVHSYPILLDGGGTVSHVINQYVDVSASVDLRSQVIQGEKMAAVGLLAGNIAHELNNPLTGIHSLSELLLVDFDKDTNTYKDLKEIKDAAERCQRIIKDLLDFSNLGSDARVRHIDMNELVAKTLPLLKVSMRTINADVTLAESPLFVEGAPQLLQQVIFNLVNNACQAMSDGDKLKVWVKAKKDIVEVGVRDTGSGIPDAIKEQIFEPFFTTKDDGKGTGLGLSMSRTIVNRFGGQLFLNEDYKDGTEFLIHLPRVKK